MNRTTLLFVYLLALVLAYIVIVLGAYVRLSDAGLGCPDWPGCYGKLIVPQHNSEVLEANSAFPQRPIEHAKAWKEMVHRYAAGMLGLLILGLCVVSWRVKDELGNSQATGPTALLIMVVFQAALGMWTVTLLLKPVIVTAHLLGGMSILALLYWLLVCNVRPVKQCPANRISMLAIFSLMVLFIQVALGGWTSANYAAVICTDFPTCQGSFWPDMNFKEGFRMWRGLGVDYEGGVLDAAARTAVHYSHRIGAFVTFITIGILSATAIFSGYRSLLWAGLLVLMVLCLQVSLGIANVMLALPLPVAVAHNAVAALLLIAVLTLLNFSFHGNPEKE